MADQERIHAQWFSNLSAAGVAIEANPIQDEFRRMLFDRIVGQKSFSLEAYDFTEIHTIHALLRVFIAFEKDTILFYELIASLTTDAQVSQQLDQIIAEERQHIKTLQDLFKSEVRVPAQK